MTFTEHQEQVIGKAVERAFDHWPIKPKPQDIHNTAVLILDYLTKHL